MPYAHTTAVEGSGKGPQGWFALTSLTASYDHPVHAQAEHSVNLDLTNPARGAAARVALELTTASAVELVRAIAQVLADVPEKLSGLDPELAREVVRSAEVLAASTSSFTRA